MAFLIEPQDNGTYRIVAEKGNLIGMISHSNTEQDARRIEMMMRIDYTVASKPEAIAFVRGVEAAVKAFPSFTSKFFRGEEERPQQENRS